MSGILRDVMPCKKDLLLFFKAEMIPEGCSGEITGRGSCCFNPEAFMGLGQHRMDTPVSCLEPGQPCRRLFLFVEVFLTQFPNIPHSLCLPKHPGEAQGLLSSVGIFPFHPSGSPSIPKKVEQYFPLFSTISWDFFP